MSDIIPRNTRFSSRPLEERAHWYSTTARAYDKARARYPNELISYIAELTRLGPASRLLEIGCGPGVATTSFAQWGCSIICVEPNPEFCELARSNCKPFPKIVINQSSFEQWPVEASAFDAVVSASAFHWIEPEVGHPKVAEALRDKGYFILLWNKEPQPPEEIWPLFSEIYNQQGLSSLGRFETEAARQRALKTLVQPTIDSGLFKQVASKQVRMEKIYTAEDYLLLLSSFSPYISLEEDRRNSLFAALRKKINDDLGGVINLSYISAADIFQKMTA